MSPDWDELKNLLPRVPQDLIDEANRAEEWLQRAHGPRYVVTQVDDGAPVGPEGRGRVATSSASRPDIVAAMLEAGRIEPGMRVLEIGTGTGYTAALLAHRLGAPNVTTIEIDPDLAARACAALECGDMTVIIGDGAQGYPARAPFDRVLSTVAAPQVPYTWVMQTRSGGLVVTPGAAPTNPPDCSSSPPTTTAPPPAAWSTPPSPSCRYGTSGFPRAAVAEVVRDTDTPERSDTDLHISHLCNNDDAPFTIGFEVAGCHWVYEPGDDDRWCVWVLDPSSRSWARFDYQPGIQRWPIHQFGPRRLFDEVAAYHRWDHAGRPPVARWRITVTPDGQRVELTSTRAEMHHGGRPRFPAGSAASSTGYSPTSTPTSITSTRSGGPGGMGTSAEGGSR